MASRLALQNIFIALLGSSNVYYQPPATTKMKYPCIVYNRKGVDVKRSNNKLYNAVTQYEVTVIDQHPDSTIHEAILALPMCKYDRHFVADNLNHDVMSLYY